MGTLTYGFSNTAITFDDRILTHLHMVITSKLRRRESFSLTWFDATGGGRNSVWLDASIPLFFSFQSGEPIDVNRLLVESLASSANGPHGLVLTQGMAQDLARVEVRV